VRLHTIQSILAMADDEYLVPKFVIVLLCMIGAAALLCCAYAVHSAVVGFQRNPDGIKPVTPEQADYMRDVRGRNIESLMREGHAWHKSKSR